MTLHYCTVGPMLAAVWEIYLTLNLLNKQNHNFESNVKIQIFIYQICYFNGISWEKIYILIGRKVQTDLDLHCPLRSLNCT